ncbi:carbohydrate ABC transporter permease [Curtobacterium sp. VKM Ac-1376]|uniref:carbohydrate ABC transporter permease n=1 Tax=Curtobacterium sp. VKM Ac-1376 TaxID=123312 RepID=UPI00188A32A9|nr:sugar ABC transporter permease [Curtobacterium sp. VKM Ac-1376]MBF4615789.1 sugar ABC transporter permease [Curtobacterium sp. VKM Ac-1376]
MTTIQDPPAEAAPPAPAIAVATGAETRRKDSGADGGLGRRSWWGAAFAAPHSIGLVVFTAFPILASLVVSFMNWPMLGERSWAGLSNYAQLFSDPIFRTVTLNTVLFVVLYVPLNLVVSLGLAAWLTPKIRHRHVFRVLFFIPTITPIVANVVVWRMLYQPGGAIDATLQSTVGVNAPNFLADDNWAMLAIVAMSVWQGFGYNMLIFSAALDSVPENQLEAAQLDGANAWQMFWRIKFPLISPSIFFATMMTLITSFQVFVQPFVLTKGGPGTSTETLVQYIYNTGFQTQQLGLASAGAWVLFAIILGITAIQFLGQKRWVHYD